MRVLRPSVSNRVSLFSAWRSLTPQGKFSGSWAIGPGPISIRGAIEVTDLRGSILSGFLLSKWLSKLPALKSLLKYILRVPMKYAVSRKLLRSLAARHLLPLFAWRWLPVEHVFTVQLSPVHSFIYEGSYDDLIGRFLFWGGLEHWEGTEIRVFYEIARMSRGVLDIGANTGAYSLIACASNLNSYVTAFEPVPVVFDQLMRNLRLNEWESRCDARCEAVSNYCGSSEFTVPSSTLIPTGSRLAPGGANNIDGNTITVRVTTADQVCLGKGPIDLVKIDVEGFEDKVLEGMHGILKEFRPFLIVEVVHAAYCKLVQDFLVRLGYKFFGLGTTRLVQISTLAPDPTEDYRNVLCVARPESKFFTRLEKNRQISRLSS